MSLLLIIWTLSLVILSAILGFAFASKKKNATNTQNGASSGASFGEFLGEQCHDMLYHVQKGIHHMKPHARYYSHVAIGYSRRGHDFFVERVFGRVEIKKGISTSFFLKSIAEHKVGTRADGGRG